jgi:hypothetical protein
LPRELIIREASDEAALPCRGVGHLRDGGEKNIAGKNHTVLHRIDMSYMMYDI